MAKKMALSAFKSYITDNPPKHISYLTENQPGFCQNESIQMKMNFSNVDIMVPQRLIGLHANESVFIIAHVDYVLLQKQPLPIGTSAIVVYSDDVNGNCGSVRLQLS